MVVFTLGQQKRRSVSRHHPTRLRVEELESRLVPATIATDGEFTKVIVAGLPTGTTSDSPALRVDPNTSSSPFAGVGSIRVDTTSGAYIGSGSIIQNSGNSFYVLTAGHVVDINDDGKYGDDKVTQFTFYLNLETTSAFTISGTALNTSVWLNPDFTGFANPSVNDDLAILKFSGTLPAGVPVYPLYTGDLTGATLTMVGYGQSGDGTTGYYVSPSFTVKRVGGNVADAFYTQDDSKPTTSAAGAKEVFRFDFDGLTSSTNYFGGPTLGNRIETTLGGGDSGGPSFVLSNGVYYLAGVNTFTQSTPGHAAPKFGSLGGGIVVGAYKALWIDKVLNGTLPPSQPPTTGGSHGGGKGKNSEPIVVTPEPTPPAPPPTTLVVAVPLSALPSANLTGAPSANASPRPETSASRVIGLPVTPLSAVTAHPPLPPSDSAGRGTGELIPELDNPNGTNLVLPLSRESVEEEAATVPVFLSAARRDAFLIGPDRFLDAYFLAETRVEPLLSINSAASPAALTPTDQTSDESVDSLAMYAALAVTLGGFRCQREKEKALGNDPTIVGLG